MKTIVSGLVSFLIIMVVAPEVSAGTKHIAILDVENQTDLGASDIGVLEKLLTTVLQTAPKDRYTVESVYLGMEEGCDDACIVASSKSSGADFAVHLSVSTFGDGYMAIVRLFDTHSGQVLASETASTGGSVASLTGPLETAVKDVRRALPGGDAASSGTQKAGEFNGLLVVTTTPPGARVYIGKSGSRTNYVGNTPFRKELPPRRYRIRVYKKDYNKESKEARLDAGETKEVHFELYRARRLMTAGHGFLWPGIVFCAASIAFFKTDLDPGGVATAAVGGTFVAAGTTLLITGGIRLKKEKKERLQAWVPAVHPGGFGLTYHLIF